jgi:predicted O-methyltransferase YrrM
MVDNENRGQSGLSPYDEAALSMLLDKKTNLNILEIGSRFGMGSTQILASHCNTLVCIDKWLENNVEEPKDAKSLVDPLTLFLDNTSVYSDLIIPIKTDSKNIKNLLKKHIFDFIFIDGDHRYKGARSDIENCLPLLKKGGIIAGHDCEIRMKDLNISFSNKDLEKDHIYFPTDKFRNIHPGVILAVEKIFNGEFNLFSDDTHRILLEDGKSGYARIWYKKIS